MYCQENGLSAVIQTAEKSLETDVHFTVAPEKSIALLAKAPSDKRGDFLRSLSVYVQKNSNGEFSVILRPKLCGGGTTKSRPVVMPAVQYFPNITSKPVLDLYKAEFPPKNAQQLAFLIREYQSDLLLLDRDSPAFQSMQSRYNTCLNHAFEMTSEFFTSRGQTSESIEEMTYLALASNGDLSKEIVEQTLLKIRDGLFTELELLRLLSIALREAPKEFIEPHNLLEAFELIISKIKQPSQRKKITDLRLFLEIAGDILDTIIDAEIEQVDRISIHDLGYAAIDKIHQDKGLKELWPFAEYAKQALVRLSTEESTFKMILRKATLTLKGGMGLVSGLKNLSFVDLEEAYRTLQEAVYSKDRKTPAYDEARIIKLLFQLGNFEHLEIFLLRAQYTKTRMVAGLVANFFSDVCQRHVDLSIRKQSASFMKCIFLDTKTWGNNKSVQKGILSAFIQLVSNADLGNHICTICQDIPAQARTRNQMSCIESLQKEGVDLKNLATQAVASKDTRRDIPSTFKVVSEKLCIFTLYDKIQLFGASRISDLESKLDDYQKVKGQRDPFSPFSKTFDLHTDLKQFLTRSVSPVFLLSGDSGSGKSTACQFLERDLWLNRELDGKIPLFIRLPAQTDPIHCAIEGFLKNQGFTDEEIEALQREKQEFVIFLDGWDELSEKANLCMTNRLDQWNAKVIITCRTQSLAENRDSYRTDFMYQDRLEQASILPFTEEQTQIYLQLYREKFQWSCEEYKIYQKALSSLSKGIYRNPLLLSMLVSVMPELWRKHTQERDPLRITFEDTRKQYELLRRDNREFFQEKLLGEPRSLLLQDSTSIHRDVEAYLAEHRPDWNESDETKYRAIIFSLDEDLFKQPFFLEVIVERIPEIWQEYLQKASLSFRITVTELYTTFVQQWFCKGEARLKEESRGRVRSQRDIKLLFLDFAKRFANQMMLQSVSSADSTKAEWKDLLGAETTEENILRLQQIRSGVPIHREGMTVYTFNHLSYMFYFAARDFFEKCTQLDAFDPLEHLVGPRQENFFYHFSIVMPGRYIIVRFLAEFVHSSLEFREALFQIIDSSKEEPSMEIAAANAITVLNVARVSLSGRDLKGTHLSGADLSHLVCNGADFSGAQLKEVKATGISAEGADFSGCDLRGISFLEQLQVRLPFPTNCTAVSKDGRWLAASGKSTSLVDLFDRENRIHIGTLSGHKGEITCLDFSPDGSRILSGSQDTNVHIWDCKTLELIQVYEKHKYPVITAVFLPSGDQVLSFDAGFRTEPKPQIGITITPNKGYLWDIKGKSHFYYETEQDCSDLRIRLFPSGESFLLGTKKREEMYLFQIDPKNPSSDDALFVGAFADCSKDLVLTGDSGHVAHLYNTKDSISSDLVGHTSPVTAGALSPSGQKALTGSLNGTIRLWDVATTRLIRTFRGHRKSIDYLSFHAGETQIISVSHGDRTARVWDIDLTESLPFLDEGQWAPLDSLDRVLLGGLFFIQAVDVSICGDTNFMDRQYFTANGEVFLRSQWNFLNQALKRHGATDFSSGILSTKNSTPITISPNGRYALIEVITGEKAYIVPVVNLETGKEEQFISQRDESLKTVCFSFDGQYAITLGTNFVGGQRADDEWYVRHDEGKSVIRAWSLEENKELNFLPPELTFNCLRSFHCSQFILAGSDSGEILKWGLFDEGSYFDPGPEEPIQCLDISLDDNLVVAGCQKGTIGIWDIRSGDYLRSFIAHDEAIESIYIAPDASMVLTASCDRSICLSDFQSGEEICRLEGDFIIGSRVAFSPDGTHVVMCAKTESKVWKIINKQLVLVYQSSLPSLSMRDARFDKGQLNENTQVLLQQHGAIVE